MTDTSLSRRARTFRRTLGWFIVESDAPIEKRRAAVERAARLPKPAKCEVTPTEHGGVPTLTITPANPVPGRHVLYLHGGGYCVGSPNSHLGITSALADTSHTTVVSVDYRLAPEHPYPAAIDDCTAAYLGLVESVDPGMVAIAGDSAGGGAALATLVRLRNQGHPLPACGYLLSPWTDLTMSGDSVGAKADIDPMLSGDMLVSYAGDYAGDTPTTDTGISPLFAGLAGLPPLYLQTGTDEVLLDDTTRLTARAREAGVEVVEDIAPELWHVYPVLAGLMPEADEAIERACRFLWRHLG